MKINFSLSLVVLLVSLSSCLKYLIEPEDILYRTLTKQSHWMVTELKVSLIEGEYSETPYWDTTLYNWATFEFLKYKTSNFTSTYTLLNTGKTVPLQHSITETKDNEVFFYMKDITDAAYLDFGSGLANEVKGDRITITGLKRGWQPTIYNGGVFSYAPFLNASAYYKCDWTLDKIE